MKRLAQILTIMALTALGAAPLAKGAEAPPLLTQFCKKGTQGGQCDQPGAIATDPNTGDIYVIANRRINKFTPWGQFVKAWGSGVVTGGATGTGILTPGSATVESATTTSKEFMAGMAIEGTGIAPGTVIESIGEKSIILSNPATTAASGGPTVLISPEAPNNVPTNELQKVVVTATGGTYNLNVRTWPPSSTSETTTVNLPYNADAAEVQGALEGLANVGPGNVAVTSPNPGGQAGVPGGPYTVEFKGVRFADTNVRGMVQAPGAPGLSGGGVDILPLRQGGSAPEVCTGSDCREGVDGNRAGQMANPRALATDSQGSLYVYESADCQGGEICVDSFKFSENGTNRVQKFDPEGNFLLMFGKDVNEGGGSPSSPGDVCTAAHIASGDTCGGGTRGDGDGEFGVGPHFGGFDPLFSRLIAVGPDDRVFVGGQERIQVFDSSGQFLRRIALPGEAVRALAVDNAPASSSYGDLYVSYYRGEAPDELAVKLDVRKLDPETGTELDTLKVTYPSAIATDVQGVVHVLQLERSQGDIVFPASKAEALEFGPDGALITSFPQPGITMGSAIASSSACGAEEATTFIGFLRGVVEPFLKDAPFVNAYGEAPDSSIPGCEPPAAAPSIISQFVTFADTSGAAVKAEINPHFWPDTRYYVQYGTGRCSEGGCDQQQPLAPGSLLTKATLDGEVATREVFIEGLAPNTEYHYRFVAQSGGGGPILGVGGTEAEEGREGSFRTLPLRAGENTACPNQVFRTGASAKLPDCRAYELVSPLDKNNGDIGTGLGSFAHAAADGLRLSFNSFRAFGDPQAAPLSSQYLAQRSSTGWSSRSIAPPRAAFPFYPNGSGASNFEYKAFSEDLCSGWVLQTTSTTFAPGAPAGVPNLYRRDICGADGYELLTTTPPPGFEFDPTATNYYPEIQGSSADASRSAIRANGSLAVEEGGPRAPLLCTTQSKAETVSYRWLRNGAPIAGAESPTYVPVAEDDGKVVQCQVVAADAEGASVVTSTTLAIPPVASPGPPLPPLSNNADRTPTGGTISGISQVSQTLTCTPGAWKNSPSFSYRWLRNGVPITGAEASTYTLSVADRGTAVQCEIVGSNAGGVSVSPTKPVLIEARTPTPGADPTISGSPQAGQLLTCNPGSWSHSPVFTYQWLRDGSNIATATASTYTVQAADEGKALQCRVRAANSDAAVLAVSARVVVAPDPPTAPPTLTAPATVTGTARVGDQLTCNQGAWSGSPAITLKWLRNGVAIGPGGETYEPSEADRGKALQCQLTASNAGGTVVALTTPRYVNPDPPIASGADAGRTFQVYLAYDGGQLRLVSVLPDGSVPPSHSSVGTAQDEEAASSMEDSVHRAVSADGSRVFWSNSGGAPPDSGFGDRPGSLYLRLNANEPQSAIAGGQCSEVEKACTVEISADPTTRFLSANPEGSRVIYSADKGKGLYEAEIGQSAGQWTVTSHLIASGLIGVAGASEGADRVYLVSTEVLTGSEENGNGDEARPGAPNLYLHETGAGFTFVGTLGEADMVRPSPIALRPNSRSSRVTPDGLSLAFASAAPLTGFDNTDLVSGEADAQIFVFDAKANAGAGSIACVSCNPSGARPRGRFTVPLFNGTGKSLWTAGILPGWISQTHPGSLFSSDGKRLFFDSYDSLVPGDSNGKRDVYEWEAAGKGDCTQESVAYRQANGGCVYLISSGQSPEDSFLFDATPSGSDVFFATQSSLLPQDYGLIDIYDARIGGGFPPPPVPPAACEGEACQGTPAPPNDPTPASATFQGAGNVADKPVRKKQQRRKAKKKRKAGKKHRGRANHKRRSSR